MLIAFAKARQTICLLSTSPLTPTLGSWDCRSRMARCVCADGRRMGSERGQAPCVRCVTCELHSSMNVRHFGGLAKNLDRTSPITRSRPPCRQHQALQGRIKCRDASTRVPTPSRSNLDVPNLRRLPQTSLALTGNQLQVKSNIVLRRALGLSLETRDSDLDAPPSRELPQMPDWQADQGSRSYRK